MNGVLFIGATGLRAQQAAVDTVANNIANINTPAFKRNAVAFSELVSQGAATAADAADAARALTLDAPQGVMVSSSPKIFEPGELRKTDNPADVAIRGAGFIELMAPGGQTYLWRGATLRVNPDGFLAAANGMPLKATISVPRDALNVQIAQNGVVSAVLPGTARAEQIGQIELVAVADTRALAAVGDGMYRIDDPLADVTRGLPGEGPLGFVQQGFAETSNVNLTDEMVGMVMMQRAYTANARVIQVADEMMQTVNQLRR
jgi:flagellar basal-body rod protein FlgG